MPPSTSGATNEQPVSTQNAPSTNMNENTKDDPVRRLCDALAAKVHAFLESEPETEMLRAVQRQTQIALGVIDTALDRYTLEEISLSYNGGKDCLVLLILFLVSLSTRAATRAQPLPRQLQSVYIVSQHPFAEIDAFVDSSMQTYHLDLTRYTMPMKQGFAVYLEEKKQQGTEIKAIFVGTRRTDPHGALLTHFDETDKGWPAFMRVHPVIDWHYAEIWAFIRHLEIPYCPLYDMGYTSLGGTTDTHPNPALKAGDGEGEGQKSFKPAYELVEDDAERLGRDW